MSDTEKKAEEVEQLDVAQEEEVQDEVRPTYQADILGPLVKF